MRALLVVVVLFVSSCGSKAKPSADPEPAPQKRMTVTETTVEVIDFTYFAPDSAEIAADQIDVLDAIVSTLEGNPEITKVEVQGHADASERDPAATSQARADAVVAYLTSKGIHADRLVAKGYGTDPVSAEDPPATNRLVSYLILERSDR